MNNVRCFQSCMSSISWWQSVEILITKFNVVNKRIWGNKILLRAICKPLEEYWQMPHNIKKLENVEEINTVLLFEELNLLQYDSLNTNDSLFEVVVTELLPKNYMDVKAYQVIVLEKLKERVTFYDVTPVKYQQILCPKFTYSLMLENRNVFLKTETEYDEKSYEWLANTVIPQFIKWGESTITSNKHICSESLSLVSKDMYYNKYNDLKLKYGKEMVKIWPEVTDPTKFVYEDVAIATYLLLLWEDENAKKKCFVDLGCGNGLLVYILTKEGHSGIGIDIRKRRIWDMYSEDIHLQEKTITPSDVHLFPEADWVIGNHSDELTPWIPVIAARSSYKCNFFLLPCCAYNFDGSKYQRKDSSKSQYTEYLEYIKQLCDTCGFETRIDRLKIPSTKRICIIGQKRNYGKHEFKKFCELIHDLINLNQNSSTNWLEDFKPRDPVERVRNCTQIDKTQIQSIVHCITEYLLEGCNLDTEWSNGREVSIGQLISLLSKDNLKVMKAECGGLQTLLKNNHDIFKVYKGKVQLRYPKSMEEVNKSLIKNSKNKNKCKIKFKPCWFYNNHPQGCPLTDNTCSYLHFKSSYLEDKTLC